MLIVEVLFDSAVGYDWRATFAHYQAIATFREYILTNQGQVQVIHWWHSDRDTLWQQAVYTAWEDVLQQQSLLGSRHSRRLSIGESLLIFITFSVRPPVIRCMGTGDQHARLWFRQLAY